METSNRNNMTTKAIAMAILAALLYGISSPVSKILLTKIPPAMMAALLYLGAGLGMFLVNLVKLKSKTEQREAKMTKNELPFILGMIALDIAAPILLMIGLTKTTSGTVSLLNNFEIVATALIALFIFKESVDRRMWIAIGFITIASIILSINDIGDLSLSMGSIFVIAAAVCWGFENNCTRMLSLKDPLQIVVVKGFGSGIGSLIIAMLLRTYSQDYFFIAIALLLGFVAYGLSIYLYIRAQRYLGAARTSAYYAIAPFIGVMASWLILREPVTLSFFVALLVMGIGTYFTVSEKHNHKHAHGELLHNHKHSHHDDHHLHHHDDVVVGEHTHEHRHAAHEHKHPHTPDMHHRHAH